MKKTYIVFIFIFLSIVSCIKINKNSQDTEKKIESILPFNKNQKISDLQKQLHTIAKNGTSSVVFISSEKIITQKYFDPFDFFFGNPQDANPNDKPNEKSFKQTALGSGVIYKRFGNVYYIITNNHVVEGASSTKIATTNKKTYKGNILGSDPDVDIAVIKIKTNDNLNIAKFGNSNYIKVGDFVSAVGNPFGLSNSMTFGIISAIGRSNIYSDKITLTDFIQTDAAINPGNSGGPLINIFGEVIGINTLIYSQSGENVGIGFAIPVNIVKNTADQLIKKGKVKHGFLGIYYKELNEEDIKILGLNSIENGMIVTEIIKNSPAEKYEISVGDIIVEINDNIIKNSRDLAVFIGKLTPGTKMKLKIFRNNQYIIKEVILGKREKK